MTSPKRPPQRKPRGRHPENGLTPAFVRNVSHAGRYCDGQGLCLDVRPTGSRGWVQRLTIRGRSVPETGAKAVRHGSDFVPPEQAAQLLFEKRFPVPRPVSRTEPIRGRKVKIFSRPTSLYCATSCNRHGKQKSALVEPQCFPPLRLST